MFYLSLHSTVCSGLQRSSLILAILSLIPGVMVPRALQHTCTDNLSTAIPALHWIILLTCLSSVVRDPNNIHWVQVTHGLVTSGSESMTPSYLSGLSVQKMKFSPSLESFPVSAGDSQVSLTFKLFLSFYS